MQLNNDEFKIVMAFRHKEEIAAAQENLARTIMVSQGRDTLEPEQVRALCTAATELDVLLTKCGFLEEFDLAAEDEETAAEDEETSVEDDDQEVVQTDTSGRANAKR